MSFERQPPKCINGLKYPNPKYEGLASILRREDVVLLVHASWLLLFCSQLCCKHPKKKNKITVMVMK